MNQESASTTKTTSTVGEVSKPDPLVSGWKQWQATRRPDDLRPVMDQLKTPIESAVRANPNLSPNLVRAKARTLTLEALRTYDPEQGANLQTHVTNYLKPLALRGGEMSRAVPSSRYYTEMKTKIGKATEDYRQIHGEDPDDDYLEKTTGIPRSRFSNLRRKSLEFVESEMDFQPDDDGADYSRRLNTWMSLVYHDLADKDREIVDMRLGRGDHGGKPMGIADVAERIGMSVGYVHKVSDRFSRDVADGIRSQEELDQDG